MRSSAGSNSLVSRLMCAVMGTAILCSLGCSGEPVRETYPVELSVLVSQKPAKGAVVVLHPVGAAADHNAPRPTGTVDESGNVQLSTFAQNDGAPPGEYTVTVVWHEQAKGADGTTEYKPDRLRGRISRPDSPTAPRVTVEKQPNKLPPLKF